MAVYSEHKAMLEDTSHAYRKHTQEFRRWFEHKVSLCLNSILLTHFTQNAGVFVTIQKDYYVVLTDMSELDIDTNLSPIEATQDMYSMENVQREPQQDDDDNYVWRRTDVPEETIYVVPKHGRGKVGDQDYAYI